ncbi:acetyl-CoA acetyltransferase, partial [Planoprotostelium fungivorum]
QKSIADGIFTSEIVPVTLSTKKPTDKATVITEDEEPKNVNLTKLPTLRPAFDKAGSVTAANSSTLNDGASAVLLMSADKAKELGLKPLARIIGYADAAQAPIEFTTAPSLAIPKLLKQHNIPAESIDLYEINEAFSVVSIANNQLLKLDPSKVNIYGGAVAMGHAIGNSGTRIVITLLNALQRTNKKRGIAAICNGGGEASAIAIERLD